VPALHVVFLVIVFNILGFDFVVGRLFCGLTANTLVFSVNFVSCFSLTAPPI
jgi:hypothetical protein